ncbi:metallophosphoesterase family protein [Massilia psychrophila]|uniref:Metallophosphatase n=1 Tax=Massilia psychrophila TaxID=1603353 RepID=A0A2G8SXT6_9BURK|nr:metallophosphoesterase family protein [Massilia psychrophila]PIL38609.1 metallophosphatase [Massilia psychrophila]GGE69569.1 phosphodiesterase [Massilia psychrophila]
MRTLVHLSDLHFGRVDDALLAPLREQIEAIGPDVVVVSGDLTQRAKSAEFGAARAYLDTLPGPQIIVPGNHDISLYNVFRRFVQPLKRYKRYITDDLDPIHVDGEIAVLGINTARSLTFKDGRINKEQVAKMHQELAGLDPAITRIVVTHHPFDLPRNAKDADLVERAPMAMAAFAECGVDLLLAGHLHLSHADSTAERYPFSEYAALVIQAGTATSTRARGEVNSFNAIRVEPARVEVDRYSWDVQAARFSKISTESFARSRGRWAAHGGGLLI